MKDRSVSNRVQYTEEKQSPQKDVSNAAARHLKSHKGMKRVPKIIEDIDYLGYNEVGIKCDNESPITFVLDKSSKRGMM